MSTTVNLIPEGDWRQFFDAFSRRHEGWLASVEILGSDIGQQVEALRIAEMAPVATGRRQQQNAVGRILAKGLNVFLDRSDMHRAFAVVEQRDSERLCSLHRLPPCRQTGVHLLGFAAVKLYSFE